MSTCDRIGHERAHAGMHFFGAQAPLSLPQPLDPLRMSAGCPPIHALPALQVHPWRPHRYRTSLLAGPGRENTNSLRGGKALLLRQEAIKVLKRMVVTAKISAR